jgi:hypothetical protein
MITTVCKYFEKKNPKNIVAVKDIEIHINKEKFEAKQKEVQILRSL